MLPIYLLAIATMATIKLNGFVGGREALKTIELYQDVINQILFLTATAVTWWFGSRLSSKRFCMTKTIL